MSGAESNPSNAAVSDAKVVVAHAAAPTAEWISDDGRFRSGDLPLWNRLASLRSGRGRRGVLVAAFGWIVVLFLAAVAFLRVVWHDGAWPLVLLNALTLYLYLPAYVALIFAVATRRFALAAVSAAVVACHIGWVAPDWRPSQTSAGGAVPDVRGSDTVRIYYANVHADNESLEGILGEARRLDPDVIVLVEMQRWWWRELTARRPLADYPHGTDLDRRNAGDVGVFSRLPVRRFEQIAVAGRTVLALDLALDDRTLRLFALHSPRPTPNSRDSYFEFWKLIERVVTKEQGPVAVIGDFNATQHSRVYQHLLEGGLRSAHEDRGRGAATTWPNLGFSFPLIRIDQVFLSPQVACISIQQGDVPGSDHRSVVVDLVLRPVRTGHDDR